MIKKLVVGIAIAFSTPSIAQDSPTRELNADGKAAIAKVVSASLKDPASASFRWLPTTGQGAVYCGFVNAKNSYGGYTGFVPFIAFVIFGRDGEVTARSSRVSSPNPRDSGSRAIAVMCAQKGYDLSGPTTD